MTSEMNTPQTSEAVTLSLKVLNPHNLRNW